MAEKEYIEREALLNAVENAMDNCEYYGEWEDCISLYNNDILDTIEKVPAADVQKVVRCKDCIYSDDFCSYGKRKCDNGNG